MTKNKYISLMVAAILICLLLFGALHYFKILSLPIKLFGLIYVVIPALFLGSIYVVLGDKSKVEVFVQRFMILTTFQLLTNLFLIAAVWYVAKPYLKQFGLQLISVFILLMAIQSILLIRFSATQSNKKNN
jgi:4-amino-4-deoxy-L-arabinose transferase-like glycosyltransferase